MSTKNWAINVLVSMVVVILGLSFSPTFADEVKQDSSIEARPVRMGGLLYEQVDNLSGAGLITQTFEPSQSAGSTETADDFIVPAGGWNVDGVIFGMLSGTSNIISLSINIYSNNAGLPGAAVCTPSHTFATPNATTMTVDFDSPCALGAGTYWLGLSVRKDSIYSFAYWSGRSSENNSIAVWRNPLDGYGTGCTDWDYLNNCGSTLSRDMSFGVYGTLPITLDTSAVCNGDHLDVTIADGNTPFTISGTGPDLPLAAAATGTFTLNGPAAWTGVTVTEDTGDLESIVLGDFACAAPSSSLNVSAVCSGDDLVVSILTGNAPFTISGTGPGLPLAAAATGSHTLTGPAAWTGVTVTEDAGDLESIVVGDFDCEDAPIVQAGLAVPNLGVVAISSHSPVAPYGAPNKERQNFALPHDSDGNGFDTYTVTATVQIEGETWVALFNGTTNWLWVPYDAVQVLVPVRGLP